MKLNQRAGFALIIIAVLSIGFLSCSQTSKKPGRAAAAVGAAQTGKVEDVCGFNSTKPVAVKIDKKAVDFTVSYHANCGLEKYSRFRWKPALDGSPYSLEITSLDYPEKFVAVNQSITGWFHQSPNATDIEYFAKQVVPLLKQAAASPSLEMATLTRDEAKERWLNYLLQRPLH